jgi:hypothetical protein
MISYCVVLPSRVAACSNPYDSLYLNNLEFSSFCWPMESGLYVSKGNGSCCTFATEKSSAQLVPHVRTRTGLNTGWIDYLSLVHICCCSWRWSDVPRLTLLCEELEPLMPSCIVNFRCLNSDDSVSSTRSKRVTLFNGASSISSYAALHGWMTKACFVRRDTEGSWWYCPGT